jgi:hypothetical protein
MCCRKSDAEAATKAVKVRTMTAIALKKAHEAMVKSPMLNDSSKQHSAKDAAMIISAKKHAVRDGSKRCSRTERDMRIEDERG